MIAQEFARWHNALSGHGIDFGKPNDPASGYYRNPTGKGMEAVAIFRDAAGGVQCIRAIFGDGSKMGLDEIDELFGCCGRYPISYELYQAVAERGEPWPDIHQTRLQTKHITAGIVWTEAWARVYLAPDLERDDEAGNPRAIIGGNYPPETSTSEDKLPQDLSPQDPVSPVLVRQDLGLQDPVPHDLEIQELAGEDIPPDLALERRISGLSLRLGQWLDKIGGQPTTQTEADVLGNYANTFKDFEITATKLHKFEKEPYLRAARTIDAKWFAPVRDKAIASRDKILVLLQTFTEAETLKRAEAAEFAADLWPIAEGSRIQSTPDQSGEVTTRMMPKRVGIATLRGGAKRMRGKLVIDPKLFLDYCVSLQTPPSELLAVMEKIARKWKAAGLTAPGMIVPGIENPTLGSAS